MILRVSIILTMRKFSSCLAYKSYSTQYCEHLEQINQQRWKEEKEKKRSTSTDCEYSEKVEIHSCTVHSVSKKVNVTKRSSLGQGDKLHLTKVGDEWKIDIEAAKSKTKQGNQKAVIYSPRKQRDGRVQNRKQLKL